MKRRTANLIICNKFDVWLETIDDAAVKALVKDNTIATGGCIASMLLGEPVNDYDFYFRNQATASAVAKYYVKKFIADPGGKFNSQHTGREVQIGVLEEADRVKIFIKSAGAASESGTTQYQYFEGLHPEDPALDQYLEQMAKDKAADNKTEAEAEAKKPKYRPVYLTENAITLSDSVQIVVRFFGEPGQIHENYDFVHCTSAWTSWDRRVTLNERALESLLTKELWYIGSKYPVCSLFRVRKFVQRGWTITAGQMMKIAMQINELDLTDFEVLKEQLTGVDVAYFRSLLDALKDKDPKSVDATYLMQLLDKMA